MMPPPELLARTSANAVKYANRATSPYASLGACESHARTPL